MRHLPQWIPALIPWGAAGSASLLFCGIAGIRLPLQAELILGGLLGNLILGFPKQWQIFRFGRRGRRNPRTVTWGELRRAVQLDPHSIWIGHGPYWSTAQARALYRSGYAAAPPTAGAGGGLAQIACQSSSPPIRLATFPRLEHLAVIGAPGSGKSQLFKLLAAQFMLRREALVILDPKGGPSLRASLKQAACKEGIPFFELIPSHPELSVHLDLWAHGRDASELASRVCQLLPGAPNNDVFHQFCWLTLQRILQAQLTLAQPLSFSGLLTHVQNQGQTLHVQLAQSPPPTHGTIHERAWNGIRALASHDSSHYQKMVPGLIPILQSLSSGGLGQLLEQESVRPDPGQNGARSLRLSLGQIVDQRGVLYVALESMSDGIQARSLSILVLAELAALAGERYRALSTQPKPLRLLIDEAGEVLCPALLQLLNKGREAGVSVAFAVQTLSDLELGSGSPASARSLLGNAAHLLALRTLDAESRRVWSERAGNIWIELPQQSLSAHSGHGPQGSQRGSGATRSLSLEQLPLIPEAALAHLPDCGYLLLMANGQVRVGHLPLLQASEQAS